MWNSAICKIWYYKLCMLSRFKANNIIPPITEKLYIGHSTVMLPGGVTHKKGILRYFDLFSRWKMLIYGYTGKIHQPCFSSDIRNIIIKEALPSPTITILEPPRGSKITVMPPAAHAGTSRRRDILPGHGYNVCNTTLPKLIAWEVTHLYGHFCLRSSISILYHHCLCLSIFPMLQ